MAAIATFLLGGCGGAELPLRSGEELARSRAVRWVGGVVRSGLGERKGKGRGVLGFIWSGWCTVNRGQGGRNGVGVWLRHWLGVAVWMLVGGVGSGFGG
jgi:hypothetical protein